MIMAGRLDTLEASAWLLDDGIYVELCIALG
jgi:hypothetical protein